MDGQKDLIQVPFITRSRATPAELIGISLPELPASIPHGFVGQRDPALRHQLFDVPVAQAEAEVQPHTMANDLGWEPMALVGIGCWWCLQAVSMPHEGRAGKGN
jgi:hypothetical protein